jgi:hypothetical protein
MEVAGVALHLEAVEIEESQPQRRAARAGGGVEELVGAEVLDVGAVGVDRDRGLEDLAWSEAARPMALGAGPGRGDAGVIDEDPMAARAERVEVGWDVAEQAVATARVGAVLARRWRDTGGCGDGLGRRRDGGRRRRRGLGAAVAEAERLVSGLGVGGEIVTDWYRLHQRWLVDAPVRGHVPQRSQRGGAEG